MSGIIMEINEAFILESIGLPALTEIARQAAGANELELLDWRVKQIGGGLGNPVSVGLYRVSGMGQDGDKRVAWSSILKVIQSPANAGWSGMGEGEDQTHWNYWKRELFVYRSGLLDGLPDGLLAPRCYGTVELAGNIACLWLEDVTDVDENAWTLDRFGLTARHIGRLNGHFIAEGLVPDYPWLSQNRIRQWAFGFPEWQTASWEHPLALARFPMPESEALRRMHSEKERFIARLDRLPQTLCHGDTYPTNFKTRHSGDGRIKTVALDWALASIAPVGFDLGQLVFGAHLNLAEFRLADIDRVLFESYLAGLRDSGCMTDSAHVRFGYTASAALVITMFQMFMLDTYIQQTGSDGTAATGYPVPDECFEAAMATAAYELLKTIR